MHIRSYISPKGARSMPKFRSGFEQTFFRSLPQDSVLYEDTVIPYIQPESHHRYTPDFRIPGTSVYLECKGIWSREDRAKHLLVKAQHPDKRIILVFQNHKLTISKSSKTTYAMWATKHGIEWMTTGQALIEVKRILSQGHRT